MNHLLVLKIEIFPTFWPVIEDIREERDVSIIIKKWKLA